MAQRDEGESCEHGYVLYTIFIVVFLTALGLGTKAGNKEMCDHGWAPTFIDCSKA